MYFSSLEQAASLKRGSYTFKEEPCFAHLVRSANRRNELTLRGSCGYVRHGKRVMSYFSSFKHKLIVNSNYNLSFSSKKSRYHDILGDGFKIMDLGPTFFYILA